jgi:hypothetical protein
MMTREAIADIEIEEFNSIKNIVGEKQLTKRISIELVNGTNNDIIATLNELLFVINLYIIDESWGFSKYEKLVESIGKEFATNKLISKTGLKEIIYEIDKALKEYKTDKNNYSEGRDKSKIIISKILPQLPSKQECTERILNYPNEAWLPYMAYRYYVGFQFPTEDSFKKEILDLILDKENGKQILPIVDEIITNYNPSSSFFQKSVKVARALLGKEFNEWYISIKGISYTEDQQLYKQQRIAEEELEMKRRQYEEEMRMKERQYELEREKMRMENEKEANKDKANK